MSESFKKIMLVTNDPCETDGAEKSAEYLAKYYGSDVLLIDTLKTPFYPSQGPAMSTELAYEVALKSKDAYLNEVKQRFDDLDINTDLKILCSPRTSSELISTVVDEECDLVIRYLKGRSSRAQGRFGETAENLMRACPVPVLFAQEPIEDPNVLACINLDHSPNENKAIIDSARKLASGPDKLLVVCCWNFEGTEIAFDYMDEGMSDQTREEAAEMYQTLFKRLVDDFQLGDRAELLNCNPETGIPEFCTSNNIDVAVMCSASLNHPLGRKLGATIERTIGSLPCALLTVKPIGFETTVPDRVAAVLDYRLTSK